MLAKEAAVLAIWLKGVTLAISAANPTDCHAACLGLLLEMCSLGFLSSMIQLFTVIMLVVGFGLQCLSTWSL